MNILPIDLFATGQAAAASREKGRSGDMFAGLMAQRAQAIERAQAGPADPESGRVEPARKNDESRHADGRRRTDERRPTESRSGERPDRAERNERSERHKPSERAEHSEHNQRPGRSEDRAAQADDNTEGSAGATSEDESAEPKSAARETSADAGKTAGGTVAASEAETGTAVAKAGASERTDGTAPATATGNAATKVEEHSNSEVARAVVTAIAEGGPRTPGQIGEVAREAAQAAKNPNNAQAGTQTKAAPAQATSTAPGGSTDSARGAPDAAAGRQNANAPLPAQVTVTREDPALISRPSATLVPNASVAAAAADGEGQAADGKTAGGDSKPEGGTLTLSGSRSAQPVAAETGLAAARPLPAETAARAPAGPGAQPQGASPAGSGGAATTSDAPVVTGLGGTEAKPAAAQANAAAQTTRPAPAPALPAEQVALQISKAVGEGMDRIDIQLKPASLGHIRVQLEVTHDGRLHAVVAADRQDTLDLLQRDARILERALQDAGLKTDSGSLSFNLSGRHPGTNGPPGESGGAIPGTTPDDADPAGEQPAPALAGQTSGPSADGRIDIQV